MPSWRLRLLGPVIVESPTGETVPRLGPKGLALLACVAAAGSAGIARTRLLQLLWEDHAPEDARNALRQCLHHVRAELGDAAALLKAVGDRLVVDEACCTVDVDTFEALTRAADLPALLAAAALYRGDFAESVAASAEFDAWAATERERLRDLAHGLVARLTEHELDADALEDTVALARRLLAADRVHEGTWRSLMRLHERAGLRSRALQCWAECRHALREELGVEPGPQTTALARELQEAGEPFAARHREVVARAAPSPPWRQTAATPPGSPLWTREHPAVTDLMLRGWQHFTAYSAVENAKARAIYTEALERVPGLPDALVAIGWSHWFDAVSGWSTDAAGSARLADSFAQRALAACTGGSGSGAAHALMGKVLLWQSRHDEALGHLRQSVAAAPWYAYAHFHLGDALTWCGRPDEALEHLEQALRLDLNDHGVFLTLSGMAHWMRGDSDAARAALDSALRRNPEYCWAHGLLAAVQHEAGEHEAARRSAAEGRRLNRRFSLDFAARVLPYRMPQHRHRLLEAWRSAGMPAAEGAFGSAHC